jgi:predicted helicase
MTDLAKQEQHLLDLLKQHDSLGNGKARELLGWDEALYEQVKGSLVAAGQVALGRGRGGSISFVAAGQEANKPIGPQAKRPASQEAPKPNGQEAQAKGSAAQRPLSPKATKPLSQEAPKPSASAKATADAKSPKAPEPEAHKPEARKASTPSIDKYYTSVQRIRDYGGSGKETAIRSAFYTLLNHYAEKKDLILITELSVEGKLGRKVTPDGTLKNALRLDYGYWESKDEADDINEEIEKKFKKGYPDRNILFEDSQTAVLIQEGREVMRVQFKDPDRLDAILNAFVNHKHPEARKFEEALTQFKADIPQIVETLRDRIERARVEKPDFTAAANTFLTLCKAEINPDITEADIREMMIQHILTADLFNKIFDEPDFHQHNNIGQQLEQLIGKLFTYGERKNLLATLEHYYEVINAAAAGIKDHHEKQQFLKVLYENFYKVYNPKAADRLGVVYTPNEIVRFMIRSTDQLLHRHFGKTLSSKNVEILDPATGTGTFLTDLIDHLPKQDLDYKYKNEIHANEVAILPYYVANLNIEYTFKQKMGYYAEFPNLCFVDTLDNTGALQYSGKQEDMFGLNSVNAERIKRQNSKKISVIIGNPPYNANQQSENDNNKNRTYAVIDKRIKDTYIKHSTAQKTKVYDMYARFYRWAMDRVERNGIIAFITNRSFIDSRTFDGFRKCVQDEFAHCYIIDTHSDVRSNPKIAGTTHNVFGIQTGVAVCIMVRKEENTGPCRISYFELSDELRKEEKLDWFRSQEELAMIAFTEIEPDKRAEWINQATGDWDVLPGMDQIFELEAPGVNTARDEWVFDLSRKALSDRIQYLIGKYNDHVRSGASDFPELFKWSASLKDHLAKRKPIEAFSATKLVPFQYRPFLSCFYYSEKMLSDRLTGNHYAQFGKTLTNPNRQIVTNAAGGGQKAFTAFASAIPVPFQFYGDPTQCFAEAVYAADGTRHDNLTDWGLAQFTTHYGPTPALPNGEGAPITKEAVFHYVYAVLHDPVYREKYALNLKREFPRIPFYTDFWQWSHWGKQLMDLHIGYESAEPYPLELVSSEKKSEQKKKKATLLDHLAEPEPLYQREYKVKVKLKADKEAGIIELDELTLLKGIPPEAWQYKLGNRSALEWVLDQYKEKKPSDPTIAEKFNTYRFADHKEKVIDLLKRVTTVSVETAGVVRRMEIDNTRNT